MARLSPRDPHAARELLADLLAVVDRHELAADGHWVVSYAHTCRALAVLHAIGGPRLWRDD